MPHPSSTTSSRWASFWGVTYEIKISGGKRSVNVAVIAGAVITLMGMLVDYSKEALFTPIFCWLPYCRFVCVIGSPLAQIIGIVLALVIASVYFVPFCQYGRSFREPDQTFSEKVGISFALLSQPERCSGKNTKLNSYKT